MVGEFVRTLKLCTYSDHWPNVLCFISQEHSKKRRRSKKAQKEYDVEESQVVDETDLIAMGTIGGNVLLYSMLQGDLKSRLVSIQITWVTQFLLINNY